MANKVDVLFGALIILLQCISVGIVALFFHQSIDLPGSTKSFFPNIACMTGLAIDLKVYVVVCISPICSVVAIFLTIQSIYRKKGYSDKVATSWIGVSTFLAGICCCGYLYVRFIIRWKLYKNGCEHPNDNFVEALLIVGVGIACHIVSTLLFLIWRMIPRKNSSFLDDNIKSNNNGKSLLISIWTVSNHMTIANTSNDITLQDKKNTLSYSLVV